MMLHQEKDLPNDTGRSLSYNDFTNKNKIAATIKSSAFLHFLY